MGVNVGAQNRFAAFISYSHADRRKAQWLHWRLTTFRAGFWRQSTPRLGPVFLDRDELAAAPDLTDSICDALDRSDRLIVLCSPASAASVWVNREIRYFLQNRPATAVICAVVDGADDAPIRVLVPPALLENLPADREPMAADFRAGRDGDRLATMKVVAALLDIGLADLLQRDQRRRSRLLAGIASTSVFLATAFGGLAFAAWRSAETARTHSAASDALVAWMLGDLNNELEQIGRLDVLDGVGARVLGHYETVPPGRDVVALRQRAQALVLVGKVRDARGDLVGARNAFALAAETGKVLLRRAPRDGERVYDHAQTVFWLAYTRWRLGDDAGAERGFQTYLDLSQRLVGLDPANVVWALEPAYAQSNLGTLLFENGRNAEALTAFASARDIFARAHAADPVNVDRVVDLADAEGWVADSLVRLGRLEVALQRREAGAALLKDYVRRNPADRATEARALAFELALARRELDLGLAGGQRRADSAATGLAALVAFDPDNTAWREYLAQARLDRADFALAQGRREEALQLHDAARQEVDALVKAHPDIALWRTSLDWRARKQGLLLLSGSIRRRAAEDLLVRTATAEGDPVDRASARAAAFAALNRWSDAANTLKGHAALLAPADRAMLAQALVLSGRVARTDAQSIESPAPGYVPPRISAYSP